MLVLDRKGDKILVKSKIRDLNHQLPLENKMELHNILNDLSSDIDKKDFFGRTKLHILAASGDLYSTNILLDKGAKCHIKDDQGLTAGDLLLENYDRNPLYHQAFKATCFKMISGTRDNGAKLVFNNLEDKIKNLSGYPKLIVKGVKDFNDVLLNNKQLPLAQILTGIEEYRFDKPIERRHYNRINFWRGYFGENTTGNCFICNKTIALDCDRFTNNSYEVGHIRAHIRGGTEKEGNLLPICFPCNRDQGTQNMIDYVIRRPESKAYCHLIRDPINKSFNYDKNDRNYENVMPDYTREIPLYIKIAKPTNNKFDITKNLSIEDLLELCRTIRNKKVQKFLPNMICNMIEKYPQEIINDYNIINNELPMFDSDLGCIFGCNTNEEELKYYHERLLIIIRYHLHKNAEGDYDILCRLISDCSNPK